MNKTILITGASKGIGRALALKLATEGANLGLVARSQPELESLKTEIERAGGQAELFVGNVADERLAIQAVAKMVDRFGRLDAVVNNAGFGIFKQAEEISAADWDSVYETNVKGTFLFSREAVKAMKRTGSGHIVNVASDVAKRVFDGGSLYCSSKFAQDAFSMALRKEVRPHGIKVSVIYSGLVDTHFHALPQGDAKHADWLTSENMADTIHFVLSAPAHVVIDELMVHP
ncbi:MAG: SDR family oxidoreductase, partial [Cytophagaceae bacterium]|nr:SDR family oxidoreductase [Cytophagaceae bacterium]